ncbi:hypothetical protein KCU78_g10766, partial [Aureobasidium melanogenum]
MATNTPTEKRTFFNDDQFSDVVIKFGDQQIFAHKVMLASGSVWFEKALCGNFSEANKKVIELHDEDASPDTIMAMLKHLYGSTYGKQEIQVESRQVPGFHLAVFTLGDKYDIETLRSDAAERFERSLQIKEESSQFWDDTIYTIQKVLGPSAPKLADRKRRRKHTAAGIPTWSPTVVLICRSTAYVWQSGRDAQFSADCGR